MLKLTDYITTHKAGLAVEPARWTDIQHDRVSREGMALGCAEDEMARAMVEAEFEGEDGVDLGREVFASLYEGEPMESEKPEAWATSALDIAKSIPEWDEMLAYTQGDRDFSAIGAADMLESIREQVIEMRQAYQEHQEQQENGDNDEDQQGQGQGEGMGQGGDSEGEGADGDGQPADGQGEPSNGQAGGDADGDNDSADADNAGGEIVDDCDGDGADGEGAAEWQPSQEQREALREAMRGAIKRTVDEIGELSETLRGAGETDGDPTEDNTDRGDLINMMRRNRRFAKLLKIAGRMSQMPSARPAKTQSEGYDATGVEESGNIAAVLPSELANLADSATEILLYKAIAEEKLLTVKRAGKKPMGRGDLVIALDESGSMQGDRFDLAQAMTIAAVLNMRKDNRNATVIGFGAKVRGVTAFTKYGTAKHNRTEVGFNDALQQLSLRAPQGGTRIDVAVRAAMTEIKSNPRADLMILTDGDTNISASLVDKLNAMKKSKGLRVTVIIVGGRETPAVKAVSDNTITVAELTMDSAAKAIGKARKR